MNSGVLVDASASIGASGIGNTTITGQGGNTTGNSNYGVFVSNGNAMITASQGDINIMGQGGGNGTSGINFGVNISTQGIVDANGSGNIFISGSGGISSGASNVGFALGGPGASVLSDTGNIILIGEEGGGSSGLGFLMAAGTTV